MAPPDPGRASGGIDFYGPQYARFASPLATEVRREVYGEDIGQQGWRTAAEQAEIPDLLRVGGDSHVLDVACGAGGPSLALVARTSCRLVGLDSEAAGIAHAEALASSRGLGDRARFSVHDCSGRLPFEDGAFDAVLCFDAICHFPDRRATLGEWARVLREGGRLLFTDPAVLTGAVASTDLDDRASAGVFIVVPHGLNEGAVESAGFVLLSSEDRTASMAEIAGRWDAIGLRHADALEREEGAEGCVRRQHYL